MLGIHVYLLYIFTFRKILGDTAHIDVFEQSDHIGGRLNIVTINGESIESGGSVIHSSNKYMVDFVKELGKSCRIYNFHDLFIIGARIHLILYHLTMKTNHHIVSK